MADAQGRSIGGLQTEVSLQVRFDAPTHGWIGVELRADGVEVVETFSHIYPALRDLCSALCDVLNDVPARTVVFLLEPAELELRFVAVNVDTVRVCVRLFTDSHRTRQGTALLNHITTTRVMVLAFWRALRRLQTSLSDDEFALRFREPFPSLEMASLTNLVALKKDRWAMDTDGRR